MSFDSIIPATLFSAGGAETLLLAPSAVLALLWYRTRCRLIHHRAWTNNFRHRQRPSNSTAESLPAFLDVSPCVFYTLNPQHLTLSYISSNCSALYAKPAEDLIAQPHWWHERLHPSERVPTLHRLRTWVEHGCTEPLKLSYRVEQEDAAPLWVEDRLAGVHDKHGQLIQIVATQSDITRQREIKDNMRLAQEVFAHAREGVVVTDASGRIIWINNTFCATCGFAREDLEGIELLTWMQNRVEDDTLSRQDLAQLHAQGHCLKEICFKTKAAEVFTLSLTLIEIRDNDGELQNLVALSCDVTRHIKHEQQLKQLINFDPLTGLPNRELLKQRLSESMVAARHSHHHLALCSLDLDNFKEINDTYGHTCGDALLCEIGSRITASLRTSDTVARVGGDEFIVILDHLDTQDAYRAFVQRIHAAVAEPFMWEAHALTTTCSIGITLYPQPNEYNAGHLLRQADHAMYQAKMQGHNSESVFSINKQKNQLEHKRKLEQIRSGLHNHEFVLYFQPKVNMRTEEILGAEALIRWQHPEQGLQSPGTFLPLIESHPLDIELGLWVIDTAMAQVEKWHALGLDLPISVNVSGYHLQHPDFVTDLNALLQRHPGVNEGDIEIEVLETSAIEDIHHVSNVIARCSEIGVDVALDDFGTGYSSLSYLKHLPVRTLKIDQSFVRDMLATPDDLSILEGVIGMANAFRRHVIAEGVETVEHGHLLLQLGCEWAQGYGIARPMHATKIPAWMAGWKADSSWKDVTPLGKTEMKLMHVGVGHRAWARQLHEYVAGKSTFVPELDPLRCALGQWLLQNKALDDRDFAILKQLDTLHRDVHKHARDVVNLCRDQELHKALARMDSLMKDNEELLKILLEDIVA